MSESCFVMDIIVLVPEQWQLLKEIRLTALHESPGAFLATYEEESAFDGGRWLSARGIFAAGSDTMAFEKVPDASMPVHVHLLVESGIHIIECLNLEELAAARAHEFVFIASPLKIRGGTGSPIRPIAVTA